jgi:cobalt-zinc-cadmium efflux system outer membrane protein
VDRGSTEEFMNSSIQSRCLPAVAALLLFAGCAGVPTDHGRAAVAALVVERGRTVTVPGDREQLIEDLLSRPLSADGAVRVALVNSPRLEVEYGRLGIAAAEVYDAGRLSNPTLSASLLDSNEPGAVSQKTFVVAQSFTSLLMLPARGRLAEAEFNRVRQSVGSAILDLAADVERAYYVLVSALQVAAMRETVATAAQVSADLARRFFDAGNIGRRELALEQAAATQARLDALSAQAGIVRARTTLNQLMGLGARAPDWTVAAQLPVPLAQEDELDALLPLADSSRLDLAVARKQVEILADTLGVTRRFRMLGEVRVGFEQERESDHSRLTGPTLSLEVPIFNQGAGAVARAEAQLQQAEGALSELEVEIVNAVALAQASVQNAKARAQGYRENLIPQREEIVERTQEQVSYMLEGQFELLLVKQQEYDAYQAYLEAVRDYWLARTDLAREVGTSLPSGAQTAGDVTGAEELTRPHDPGMGHQGMQMDRTEHPVTPETAHGDQP